MSDLKSTAVKYWPWIVGGGIGLLLISRMGGNGGSSGSSGIDPVAANMQLESMRIGAQSGDTRYVADTQRAISMYDADAEMAVKFAGYEAQTYMAGITTAAAVEQSRLTGMTTVAVNQIGAGVQSMFAYADVIKEMNQPSITAMETVASQNVAAINALATIGVETMRLKGDIANKANIATVNVVDGTGFYMGEMVDSTGFYMGEMAGNTKNAWNIQGTDNFTPPALTFDGITDAFGKFLGVGE